MLSRRDFLAASGAAFIAPKMVFAPESDMDFLKKMVLDTLEGSRVQPGTSAPADWAIKNTGNFALVTPGRLGYPAFWIRDFSMAADSGLMPAREIEDHLFLAAKCQTGDDQRTLGSGGILPPHAIPDHINFDSSPVYYPGTYSAGEDQGAEPWGIFPPADDHFEFIHIAWLLATQTRKREFLKRLVMTDPLISHLEKAYTSPTFDPVTQLFETREEARAVGFGFCDSVTFTGRVLYPSLLRYRAAKELATLTKNADYEKTASTVKANIDTTFREKKTGWLLAATGIGRQPDVWGTLLALHLDVLKPAAASKTRKTIVEAYKAGTITLDAAVRHVPTDRDFSATSAWEKALTAKGIYQNGAYWHTPTGWLIEELMKEDQSLGKKAFGEYIAHLRKGGNVPWECFNPALNHYQNGGYLASVAWPYSVLRNIPGLA